MAIRRKITKPRIKAPKKTAYYLVGGPMDGAQVWLSTPSTLPLVCKGQRGVYQPGKGVGVDGLRWFPAVVE